MTRNLKKLADLHDAAPLEEEKEEIIGVNVLNEHYLPAKPAAVQPDSTKVSEEQQKALPDPKKKLANKQKAQQHRDEGAFQTYIFRVFKEVCPDSGLSKKAMQTMEHIVADKFEAIMHESRALILNNKKQTLSSKEVETACRLLIRGELGANAIQAGRKALTKFSTQAE